MENKTNTQKRFIVSGGGTGGHIFPAISIAKAIQAAEPTAEILFVGAHGRMEMEKVPAAGFKIIGLPIAGLQRKSIWKNIMFIPKLLVSLSKCRSIIKAFNPDVVIGVGGYASGPLLYKAQQMGIPTLIQEQNSYAGVTNKLLAKKAKTICVAYDNMEKFFPKDKIVMTGNPVRKDLQNIQVNDPEAIHHFNLNPELKTLLVIGGSLGARTINESIAQNLDLLIRKKIQVIWQTGNGYYDEALSEISQYNNPHVHVLPFINRMDLAYSVADIIISRAGAGTISELAIVGKPVILVPSPNVAEDHQTKNAAAFVEKGAAIMVKDAEARQKLVPELIKLLESDDQQVKMRINLKKLAVPNSDEMICNQVFKLFL
jgi:UDP-N-acetylglucosamine--N-acetylmuramyl-(pentapeptide) pyrophosphoryl-undecaprenol N-acetylglucosamine transferase